MLGFNYKKSVQALNLFAIKAGGRINKMRALKLIWLSDRLHLRMYGRPILNDTYFALNYGPVASHTKDIIENTSFLSPEEKEYRSLFIKNDDQYFYSSISDINPKIFSKTDIDAMEKVYQEFGSLDKFKLSDESHKYPEWKKFEGHLKSKSASRFEMNYEDFFEDPEIDKNENSFFKSSVDALLLTKEMFLENGYIYRLI